MILGLRIIGGILLIGLLTGMSPSMDNLWSRKIMTCQSGKCSIDLVTWESNQEHKNHQGHYVESTKHFCSKPEHWSKILKSMVANDGNHNRLFLDQALAGNCFEMSFDKKAVVLEIALEEKNWYVRRAQWI